MANCPIYNVEIHGDGTVVYEGLEFVAVTGKHTSHISEQAMHDIFERFKKADFFKAYDSYVDSISDQSDYTLSLSFDGHKKVIRDYFGQCVGMPEVIHALEEEIDSAAATEKWVKGNAETFGSLQAEHWDFHAADDEHLGLLSSAAVSNDTEFLRQLLAAGVLPNNYFGCQAVSAEAEWSNVELVRMLLVAGAPVHAAPPNGSSDQTCDALSAAAPHGVPEVVRAILAHHPDVNWRDSGGYTALLAVATYARIREIRPDQDFGAVAQLLIDAGADVNMRDGREHGYSSSALMIVNEDAGFVRALLKAGAKDVNARDFQDHTPLMNSFNPDVTQALLEGGADPWMVDNDGKTALDIAKKESWRKSAPLLERWMAENPRPN
jgi:ankyrin repeat protein